MTPARPDREEKYRDLLGRLAALGKAVVAFSGGLDSTVLLHAASQALGDGVLAVTIVTPYMPAGEIEEGRLAAKEMGVRHRLIETPIAEVLRDNPPDRCYVCKRGLCARFWETAGDEGISHVLDGTNLDDLDDYRLGMRALAESGIQSPLLASGLTKQDLREIAREQGLAVWNKPAGACLLTRLPHGVRVEEEELRRIDAAEDFLKTLGFTAVRVRSHGGLARIEAPRDRLGELLEADARHGIEANLRALGYRHVTVDLAGYRMGSLNENAAAAEKD